MATTEARPAARDPTGLRGALTRPAVLAPLLAGLAAAIATAAASPAALARTLPVEDAYYALAVSRNVALGHGISADGLAHTNGFQPLWVVLNVPLYLLTGGDRIAGLRLSQVLGTLLWLGFVALLAAQARALARRHGATGATAAAAAAIVAAGSASVFRIFHNGLETGLTLVLLAGCVLLLDATTHWTVRRVLAAGVLLGALAWARLDAVAFVAAFGLVAVVRARRGAVKPLLACVLAAVLLAPWLAYNVSLDGSPMPSSGKAEGGFVDVGHNLDSALRAAGDWAAPPVLRSSMHYNPIPLAELVSVLAIGLVIAAVVVVRRRARPPLGDGTVALLVFVVFLLGWYTLHFGAWWFEDRYLAPLLLLTVPWAATALELGRPRARTLGILSAVVLVLNVPVLVVLALGPTWRPPGWSSPATNLGTHTNLNYEQQLAWVQRHVQPSCIVGGFEAGTLLYFRDRVVNLDGKVNHDALVAANTGRTPQYVDARRIDVLDDIDSGIARSLRGRSAGWRKVSDGVRYDAWVRRGREGACLR